MDDGERSGGGGGWRGGVRKHGNRVGRKSLYTARSPEGRAEKQREWWHSPSELEDGPAPKLVDGIDGIVAVR